MNPPIGRSDAACPVPEEAPSLSTLSRNRIGARLQTLFEPVFEVESSERIAELLLQLGNATTPPPDPLTVSS